MNSNLKTLLGVGTIAWLGYVIYKNNKQDKLIQEIKNELEDAKAKLEGVNISELPTKVKETFGMAKPNVDLQIFGDKVSQVYNASKNATVAPAPYQVVVE
jgi:uncharacterized protein YjbJ (UPF0337 family)